VRIFCLLGIVLLTACSSVTSYSPDTLPTNQVAGSDSLQGIKRIVIASVNYGEDQTPSYLRDGEKKVDNVVTNDLKDEGYEVVFGNQFESAWARAVDYYGDYIDPSTASFRQDRFNNILSRVLNEMKAQYQVDAILFTNLIPVDVTFEPRDPYYAEWDGIRRRPNLKGGRTIPADNNWARAYRAVSLGLYLFNTDGQLLFRGRAGMEVVDNMSLKGSRPVPSLNNDRFDDEDVILDSVRLAFHPLITMDKYPGK